VYVFVFMYISTSSSPILGTFPPFVTLLCNIFLVLFRVKEISMSGIGSGVVRRTMRCKREVSTYGWFCPTSIVIVVIIVIIINLVQSIWGPLRFSPTVCIPVI